jgi:hypothetical protein
MRANAGIFIIICLLFLVGTVAAVGIPDKVTITSDKSYLIANNVDQATITVIVENTTAGFAGPPNPGAIVTFAINNTLGTLSSPGGTTDSFGKVSSTFKVKTTSGVTRITTTVNYNGTEFSNTKSLDMRIDHNKAYIATFSHPIEGEVDTTVPLKISFTDYYGNPIDQLINSNQSHTINLHVYGPPPDDCNFVGYGHDILNQPLDTYGNVSVQIKLTTGAGPNSITMDQFELIPPPSQRIITAVSSDVSSMTQLFNPESPPGVPADGVSKFSITYTLFDKFRNPAGQKELWVNTSVGGNTKFKTDNLGRIAITYGPRIDPGIITINATAVANPLVNSSDNVEFTSTAATTIVLTANPEIMVSRDKNALANSLITAKITNIMGGVAPGETVTFSRGAEQYPGGPYNVTNFSSFSPTSVLTTTNATSDGNGDAMVTFYPGSFNTNPLAVNYSSTATGQVWIDAKWTNSSGKLFTKTILVKWKNYPYLSARTSVNPDRINVNETVDVTINLNADGWALQPLPIDVILCTDRSGTMMGDNPDRMVNIMGAAGTFVDSMSTNDQIGLVSFGAKGTAQANTYTITGFGQAGPGSDSSTSDDVAYRAAHYPTSPKVYSDYATLDLNLSLNKAQVKTTINSMIPYSGTPMRSAIYKSINEINLHKRSNTVKGIILLSDGDYNWYGDPLAQGTGYADSSGHRAEDYNLLDTSYMTFTVPTPNSGPFSNQNMSVYAKNNGIRIYSIAFGSSITPSGKTTLSVLANATGGKFYTASATDIEDVYKAIAGDLQDTAGVDTKMVADFKKVNVTGVDVNGYEVFDYVFHPTASTKISWQDGITTNVTDQSDDWNADNKLNFTIGTMKVGQTWEATFRLKVKKSGSIDVFGPNSALIFNNSGSIETLNLPRTFLTVTPNLTTGFELEQIDVVGSCSVLDQKKAILPILWWTTYTGGPTVIYEEVNYIDETGAHITFYKGSYPVNTSNFTQRNTIFDMKTVPQNRHYDIEVRTYTANAQDSTLACGGASYNATGKTFIKLN